MLQKKNIFEDLNPVRMPMPGFAYKLDPEPVRLSQAFTFAFQLLHF